MAISTCDRKVKPPKGMLKFEVIRTNIRDSLGQYCEPGDMAVLDEKTAKRYLDLNMIRVALPDFEADDDDSDSDDDDGDDDEGSSSAERPARADTDRTDDGEQASSDGAARGHATPRRSRRPVNR